MQMKLIRNATIVNEGQSKIGSVYINDNGIIERIVWGTTNDTAEETIDADGMLLIPGVIDDQVHFREPGLTHKADIESESHAAVAGGVTSYMEMPNTKPTTTTVEALDWKYSRAAEVSTANYSFWIGATNDNIDTIKSIDYSKVCGIKLFMGSSTGNMLVDNEETLNRLFAEAPCLIATHCEDEATIKANMAAYKEKYGEDVPMKCHAEIRSAEACYKSSAKAAELARKNNAHLHILHLSSAQEIDLLDDGPLSERHVTGEVCAHHLWFSDEDYDKLGSRIKWNPSIKSKSDRDALRAAVKSGRIAVVATDHAPHTKEEKAQSYFNCPSGGPFVQFSLPTMLTLANQGNWNIETVVDQMCHRPAELFKVSKRGYIRPGYYADLVLVKKEPMLINVDIIQSKCKWSPLEGTTLDYTVKQTFVNGQSVYSDGKVNTSIRGMRLEFDR
ncbi:MAG: dihydroorotase [Bacteroidales bacterium]|nr:dihydroorotase [Bacteroidales bacterium]